MRKIFTLLCTLAVMLAGCKYDDSDLKRKVGDIDDRLTELQTTVQRMNGEISALNMVVQSAVNKKAILDITETTDGYAITFSDGTSISITQSVAAGDQTVMGVKQDLDGLYYWSVTKDGLSDWLRTGDGSRIPVLGQNADGNPYPVLSLDAQGYWTIDYGKGTQRIQDADGDPVKVGDNGSDAIFESVDTTDPRHVTFTLSNGTMVTLPRTSSRFAFEEEELVYFASGETQSLKLEVNNIKFAEVLKKPQGWSVDLNLTGGTATITAPSHQVDGGLVSLIALDYDGNTLMAALMVTVGQPENPTGYAALDGMFVIIEGNMTTENGTLMWFDGDMNPHTDIFENVNDGKQLGNVVQDIFIANGKIYIISQNGSSRGGSDRFVVCNAQTMKMEFSSPLSFTTDLSGTNTSCWPQHLVVVSPTKGYIQWASAGTETHSGIRTLDLTTGMASTADIPGTAGEFTKEGATKGRMVYSRGKVFAGTGESVVIINPQTDQVEKKVQFGRQVKGLVKGNDGNIYIALAGEYDELTMTGGTLLNDPKIVGIDHQGQIVHEKELSQAAFPIGTASPKILIAADFNEPYLYFTDKNEFYYTSIGRYDYSTGAFDPSYITSSAPDIYGYVGAHPQTRQLIIGASNTGNPTTTIRIYNPNARLEPIKTYSNAVGFPAGIDFGYRFSPEYINR